MKLQEAFELFGLDGTADQKTISKVYKNLMRNNPSYKRENQDFAYKVNEARDILMKNLKAKNTALVLSVANSIRDISKREKELHDEANILISEAIVSGKSKLQEMRTAGLVMAFVAAAFALYYSGFTNYLDLSYERTVPSKEFITRELAKNPIYLGRNYDSLYANNATIKNEVDNTFELTIRKKQKASNSRYKFLAVLGVIFSGLVSAYFQFMLKKYENSIDKFKEVITIKSTLVTILKWVIKNEELKENKISDHEFRSALKRFVNSEQSDDSTRIRSVKKYADKISDEDFYSIMLLKLQEKELIVEVQGKYPGILAYELYVS